jgi:hypothetical protein
LEVEVKVEASAEQRDCFVEIPGAGLLASDSTRSGLMDMDQMYLGGNLSTNFSTGTDGVVLLTLAYTITGQVFEEGTGFYSEVE